MEDIAKLVDQLFTVGERLPPSLHDAIVERRHEAEPLLIALIDDDALYAEQSRGEGYAPLHALRLLGALESVAAVPNMLRVVETSDHMDIAYSTAIHALKGLGAHVLEAGLAAYAATSDEKFRESLSEVLAGLGVRDERIYQIIVDRLRSNVMLGACNLASYGDPKALPLLTSTLDECPLAADDSRHADHDPIELAAAIEDLGGRLTESQQWKLERARAAGRRFAEVLQGLTHSKLERAAPAARRPGRNAPCHCGSGKKYKKCHLHDDENASLV